MRMTYVSARKNKGTVKTTKTELRLPVLIHREIKREAFRLGLSMNALINQLIYEGLLAGVKTKSVIRTTDISDHA